MNHVASAAHRAGSLAGAKIKKAVNQAKEEGYFEPICTERHLSVRHYTWDAFRYVGDITHLAALVLCIVVVLRESGTDGVSFKTHLLSLIVFTARFLNIFFCEQSIYLILYKVLLWTGTLKIVILMWVLGSGQDKRDTLPLLVVLVPSFIVALVFGAYSVEDHGLIVEFLWIFSMYLESVAMLPQYIYCYRDTENTCPIVSSYVFAMGGYRMVFGLSWAYHYLVMPYYLDMSSLISGVLGIVFFCDYLLFKVARRSTLSHLCISVDDTIREAEEAAMDIVSGEPLSTLPLVGAAVGAQPERLGRPVAEVELSSDVACHPHPGGALRRPP
eukprot:CAMPEP_0171192722 /NCGR_PEP_ID=MMETSP0790-20130122/20015_1 /TAXON_ID=2925 /ORGANISM="Alexandrium catenella, Strain OF101" /LENGTH=328 /DNA_ID=CAMNT_0011657887 /DNA_START=42 /DNA_END=1025 /DNA_ORIENTATION=+